MFRIPITNVWVRIRSRVRVRIRIKSRIRVKWWEWKFRSKTSEWPTFLGGNSDIIGNSDRW